MPDSKMGCFPLDDPVKNLIWQDSSKARRSLDHELIPEGQRVPGVNICHTADKFHFSMTGGSNPNLWHQRSLMKEHRMLRALREKVQMSARRFKMSANGFLGYTVNGILKSGKGKPTSAESL